MAGPDSSSVSAAWCVPIPLLPFGSLALPLLWGLSTGLHYPLSQHPEPTRLTCSLTSSYLTTCFSSSNQGIICEVFFGSTSFSEVRLLPLCGGWTAKFCAVLQSGQVCSASDRYLLKFLLFQWFISSAGILSLCVYISLIVLVWNRKGRVVCLYSQFPLWNWQCRVAVKRDPGACARQRGERKRRHRH